MANITYSHKITPFYALTIDGKLLAQKTYNEDLKVRILYALGAQGGN